MNLKMNDDFLDEEDAYDYYGYSNEDDTSEEEGSEDDDVTDDDDEGSGVSKKDVAAYEGKLTPIEMSYSSMYDDIISSKKDTRKNVKADSILENVAAILVKANPKHTSSATQASIVRDLFGKQGHNRLPATFYTATSLMKGSEVDEDYFDSDDPGFNERYTQESRDYIARFIGYLAGRDLSEDSIMSRRRKQRQIPAFIIFLFTSGMYDFILQCPTMPKEYDVQINNAMKKLTQAKYDIVEQLARRYEEEGKPDTASAVRKMGLSWFDKEPAELRSKSSLAHINLTYSDVQIYREYRSRFLNTSKSITQDVISDLILVVRNEEGDSGVMEKLKDRTRQIAIDDVKQVFRDWSKENPIESDLSTKIIWNKFDA